MTDRAQPGQVVLVTGGGGGIGRSICSRLRADGFHIIVQDIDAAAAQATAEVLGSGTNRVVCDITSVTAVDAAFEKYEVAHLVHAAGVDHTTGDGSDTATDLLVAFSAMTDHAWRRMQEIHVDGGFYCTRALVRGLLARQAPGSAVYLSSISGTAGYGPLHYATAKASLVGLAKALARSGAPHGIRANAVAPGMIDTAMTQSLPEAFLEHMRGLTPLGRLGAAEEVAGVVSYLLSPSAAFLTGQVISPNGGLVIA